MNAQAFEAARRNYTRFAIESAARLAKEVGFSYDAVAIDPDLIHDDDIQREFAECSRTRRPFRVWSGASDNTVFTCREGNWAFRFWHDVVSHAVGKLGFDMRDELTAGMQWVRKVSNEFGAKSLETAIAYADTCGQTLYCAAKGEFPVDQIAFVSQYVAGVNIADIRATLEGVE